MSSIPPSDVKPLESPMVTSKSNAPRKKPRNRRKKQSHANLPRLKIVVRRLPPSLPESVFWESASQFLPHEFSLALEFKSFCPGKVYKTKGKENLYSRAYLKFNRYEDLVRFYQNYNGHCFVDSKGNEYRCIVEFALNQKVSSLSQKNYVKKLESKVGMYVEDPMFLEFKTFKEAQDKSEKGEPVAGDKLSTTAASSMTSLSLNPGQSISRVHPKTTPLIEFLRSKAQKKDAQQPRSPKKATKNKPTPKSTKQPKKAYPKDDVSKSKTSKKKRKQSAAVPSSTEPSSKSGQQQQRKAVRNSASEQPSPKAESGQPSSASTRPKPKSKFITNLNYYLHDQHAEPKRIPPSTKQVPSQIQPSSKSEQLPRNPSTPPEQPKNQSSSTQPKQKSKFVADPLVYEYGHSGGRGRGGSRGGRGTAHGRGRR